MKDFARYVAGKLGLVGVDMTGLKGVYDFKVDWKSVTDEPGVDPVTNIARRCLRPSRKSLD
jgi:uncharacterized protein (TIGR03435 family)